MWGHADWFGGEIFDMVIKLREASSFSPRGQRKQAGGRRRGFRKQHTRSQRYNDGLGWAGFCQRITVCLRSSRSSPRPMFQSPESTFAPTANMKIEGAACVLKNTRCDGLCVCVCVQQNPPHKRKANCALFSSLRWCLSYYLNSDLRLLYDRNTVLKFEKKTFHHSWRRRMCLFVCLFVQGQTPTLQDYNTAVVLYYTRYTVPSEASWHPASSFCWFTGIFLEKTNQSTGDRTVLARLFRLNTAWSAITMLSSICRRWRQNTRDFRTMLSKRTVQPDYF